MPTLVNGEFSLHVAMLWIDGVSHVSNPRPAAGPLGADPISGADRAAGLAEVRIPDSCPHPRQPFAYRCA